MKTKLTQTLVNNTQYNSKGPSTQRLEDSALPGFQLRLYPSGRKAYLLRYTYNGTRQVITIGGAEVLTLGEARKRAIALKQVLLDGHNPAERRLEPTLQEFAAIYIANHAKPHKRSWQKDEQRLNKHLLPVFGARRLSQISRADVQRLRDNIGVSTPTMANRVVELLSTIYRIAEAWGAYNGDNPASKIKAYKETKRNRYLSHDEIRRLIESLQQETNVYLRGAIWLLLLTGCRKDEILKMQWSWINLQLQSVCIPAASYKTGIEHIYPLSSYSQQVLAALPRVLHNPYVIVGSKFARPMASITTAWHRIRQRAGLTDVTLHDLRRTAATLLLNAGTDYRLVQAMLGHVDSSTTGHYAYHTLESLRVCFETLGDLIVVDAARLESSQFFTSIHRINQQR